MQRPIHYATARTSARALVLALVGRGYRVRMRKAQVLGNPPTLADVVHRAAEVTDPEGHNDGVSDLLRRFEDRDELLRLAARAEFDGRPPEPAAAWLAEQGVEV